MRFKVVSHTIDETRPLIYMWEIRDDGNKLLGRYVGSSKNGSNRPRTHYSNNVGNLLIGRPYRPKKPDGFRRIHKALAEAEQKDLAIYLHFVCNVGAGESIRDAEHRVIAEQRSFGAESWQLNETPWG